MAGWLLPIPLSSLLSSPLLSPPFLFRCPPHALPLPRPPKSPPNTQLDPPQSARSHFFCLGKSFVLKFSRHHFPSLFTPILCSPWGQAPGHAISSTTQHGTALHNTTRHRKRPKTEGAHRVKARVKVRVGGQSKAILCCCCCLRLFLFLFLSSTGGV